MKNAEGLSSRAQRLNTLQVFPHYLKLPRSQKTRSSFCGRGGRNMIAENGGDIPCQVLRGHLLKRRRSPLPNQQKDTLKPQIKVDWSSPPPPPVITGVERNHLRFPSKKTAESYSKKLKSGHLLERPAPGRVWASVRGPHHSPSGPHIRQSWPRLSRVAVTFGSPVEIRFFNF